MPEIIAGRNPVIEALKAGRPINKILVYKGTGSAVTREILSLAKGHGVPVEFVEERVLERLAPDGRIQGILAYTASKDYVNLDDLAAIPGGKNETPLYVILDGIEDPQNFGAILRTAEAAGVHGVIVRARRAVGLTSAVAKASAGAIEYVPVARVANISQAIEALKRHDIWVVGIDMKGEPDYTRVDFKLPTALVIGAEGEGLSDLVRKRCDTVASIPMKGKIGSLNASVAAAIVLYEAVRQRSG